MLRSLATWTRTTDRIIMRFGETTFLPFPPDHPVSIHYVSLYQIEHAASGLLFSLIDLLSRSLLTESLMQIICVFLA